MSNSAKYRLGGYWRASAIALAAVEAGEAAGLEMIDAIREKIAVQDND